MLGTVVSTYTYCQQSLIHFGVLKKQCMEDVDYTVTLPGGVCGTIPQITHSDISVGKMYENSH